MSMILDGRFFYIIVQRFKCPMCPHEHIRVGFGVTDSVYNRIDDYIAHTFGVQSFKYLFYGPRDEINIIEEDFKELKKPVLLTIARRRGKWRLECLDPEKTSETAEDIKEWVINYIKNKKFDTKILQDRWLPYRGNSEVQRAFISKAPEDYLKEVQYTSNSQAFYMK